MESFSNNKSVLDQELDEADDTKRLLKPAKELQRLLKPITSQSERRERRWFWELLQNATDNAKANRVNVRLSATGDRLTFQHDGRAFRPIEAKNLISPDTAKDDGEEHDDDPIGEFGTGFISTHVLSASIRVLGFLASERCDETRPFSILLDRTGFEDINLLKDSIKNADDDLKRQDVTREMKGGINTSFVYDLTQPLGDIDTRRVVQKGLEDIEETLPYVMSFVDRVGSVEIVDERDGASHILRYTRSKHENGSFVVEVEKDGTASNVTIIGATVNATTVAVRVDEGRVVPLSEKMARVFKGFPLVGSHGFPFPAVTNSLAFETTTEREAIELSNSDQKNRKALTDALEAYGLLLDELGRTGVANSYNAVVWPSGSLEGQAVEWYKGSITPSLIKTMGTKCPVRCITGSRPLAECRIPFIPKSHRSPDYLSDLFDLLEPLYRDQLPMKDEALPWYDNLSFDRFKGLNIDLEELVKRIADLGSLSSLPLTTEHKEPWLRRVTEFALQHAPELLDKLAIVPNQRGDFKQCKGLYRDVGVDEGLVKIFEKLTGEDYRACLINPGFETIEGLLPKEKLKNTKMLARGIDESLQEHQSESRSLGYINAVRLLGRWCDATREGKRKGKEELEELFPWFADRRAQLYLDSFDEAQRDSALVIVSSGKLEGLSKLATSNLTAADIEQLASAPARVLGILRYFDSRVDDEDHADDPVGKEGEGIVHDKLLRIFPESEGYKVDWSSKRNIDEYDFEVRRNGAVIWYVDAKTTAQGIANSHSIPFFMRMSQWQFLLNEEPRNKYWIARVFLNDNSSPDVCWLRVTRSDAIA